MEGYIEITGADLKVLVKKAYELSSPRGLGFLHAKNGPLTDEQADSIIDDDDQEFPVDMDYVLGRAVKLTVQRDIDSGKIFIPGSWYDHSVQDLRDLLTAIGTDPNLTN